MKTLMFCREMIDRMIHLLFLRERRRKRYLRPLKIVFLLFTTAHYYFMLVCLCISALQPPTWHHLHVEFCESFCISPNIMISLPIILVYHLVASTWDRLQYFTHPSPRHQTFLPSPPLCCLGFPCLRSISVFTPYSFHSSHSSHEIHRRLDRSFRHIGVRL